MIKVLIIDDSAFTRHALNEGLNKNPELTVVATAINAYDARDKIIEFRPDVLILDIEMPKMNGLEFLKKLMPQFPLPVIIMVNPLSIKKQQTILDALDAGAVDFITKPETLKNLPEIIDELCSKIKIAATIKVDQYKRKINKKIITPLSKSKENTARIIAIGASTGGTEAIGQLLFNLPENTPGIVICIHMPPGFTKTFAEKLNTSCKINIKEAQDGDIIATGTALIAPGNYHTEIKKSGDYFITKVYQGPKINGHRPSVDILFNSCAKYPDKVIGIILTGMGKDGALGLKKMHDHGSKTIGQNKESCVVYGMPQEAKSLGAVDIELPIELIGTEIIKQLNLEYLQI